MSDIEGFEQSKEYVDRIISEAYESGIDPERHLANRKRYEELYINMAHLQGIPVDYNKLWNMRTVSLQRLVSAMSPNQKRKIIKEYPKKEY